MFARDRFLRIYPAFFVITLLSYIFFLWTGYGDFKTTPLKILLTLLVVPLNYCHILDLKQIQIIDDSGTNFILPPFWSLGAEIQAYILISLLLFLKAHKVLKIMIFATLSIFTLSNLGYLDSKSPDDFSYIYLLGTFWSFGVGYLFFNRSGKTISIVLAILICNIIMLLLDKKYSSGLEASFGAIISLICIFLQDRYKIKLKNNMLLGNLSYHIFLVHYLFIFISYMLFNGINMYFILINSFLLSLLFIYLDKYFNMLRNI